MAAITCFIRYELKMERFTEFEEYARAWMRVIPRFGGIHHGYFLPSEGASDLAYTLFSFPSLAAYEQYRIDSANDPECQALWAQAPALMHRMNGLSCAPCCQKGHLRWNRRLFQPPPCPWSRPRGTL